MKNVSGSKRVGFTLIELLVVVAIIAVLISILLPALSRAKKGARATACSANLHDVGHAFQLYLTNNNAVYPASYMYPINENGDYQFPHQPQNKPYGYLHWSWFLYNGGEVNEKAFTCPEFPSKGGCPRTYPGPDEQNREGTQYYEPASREDKQAPRMAYTANAAIVPRNKFDRAEWGYRRANVLVNESQIRTSRRVVLATEFQKEWESICVNSGNSDKPNLSKSHRPIMPFSHYTHGSDEYMVPPDVSGFHYGWDTNPDTYGLAPQSTIEGVRGLIDGAAGPETNAVGRHHPGGDKLGGTANFLYIDGSVSRKTILQTLKQWEWGDRYYSLTGDNELEWEN